MNPALTDGRRKRRACTPLRVPTVFTTYAVVFGVGGMAAASLGRTTLDGVFGACFLLAAGCAAILAAIKNARIQQHALFWFAIAHTAAWLAILTRTSWAWRPGFDDAVTSVIGTLAWLLFYIWLTLLGEFPQRTSGGSLFLKAPAPAPGERLRSQYEQKIRQAAAQEERNRLARDLHDSIKQQIFAIQTAAATAQVRFDGNSGEAREALDQIRSSAREAMTEMEVMLDQLRAEPLEHTGLVEALKKLCETIGFRTGAQVEFKLGEVPPAGMLAPGAAEATLRIAQEALANVARHARASHVLVSLDSSDGRLELTIKDDGAGFDPQQDSRGMGTSNMRTRAAELGGTCEIVSRPAEGTTVKFSIPYSASDPAANRRRFLYRNISLGLFMVPMISGGVAHHWTLLPAVAFTAVIAGIHYATRTPGSSGAAA
jgi:signal transduction histidine kinase